MHKLPDLQVSIYFFEKNLQIQNKRAFRPSKGLKSVCTYMMIVPKHFSNACMTFGICNFVAFVATLNRVGT